jgi:hypothetical protein
MRVEAAHTVGRKYQDEKVVGPRGGESYWVNPDSIVPLCSLHHKAYDERRLSLLGKLTMKELRNAVRACRLNGLDARRRLGGGRSASRRVQKEV